MEIIGIKIKKLVKERKLTDAAFARLLGTKRTYPAKLYKQDSVSTNTLEKISQVLKVSMQYWFNQTIPETQAPEVNEPEEENYSSEPLTIMKKLIVQNEQLLKQNEELLKLHK